MCFRYLNKIHRTLILELTRTTALNFFVSLNFGTQTLSTEALWIMMRATILTGMMILTESQYILTLFRCHIGVRLIARIYSDRNPHRTLRNTHNIILMLGWSSHKPMSGLRCPKSKVLLRWTTVCPSKMHPPTVKFTQHIREA